MLVEKRRSDGYLDVELMFHDDDGNPFDDPELATKQCFRDECDINNIVNRFTKAGVLPPAPINGVYGDFSEIGSYQEALMKVQQVDDMFDALPAKLRSRFDNNPALFLDFIDNPDNHDELVKLGLVEANKPVESVDVVAQTDVGSEQ